VKLLLNSGCSGSDPKIEKCVHVLQSSIYLGMAYQTWDLQILATMYNGPVPGDWTMSTNNKAPTSAEHVQRSIQREAPQRRQKRPGSLVARSMALWPHHQPFGDSKQAGSIRRMSQCRQRTWCPELANIPPVARKRLLQPKLLRMGSKAGVS
jgi:hypothetical protein